MRRRTRLGLAVIVASLVIAGGYTAFWLVVAARIKSGVAAWAQSAPADKVEVSWQRINVSGYPIAFRVELDSAKLRDDAMVPAPELRIASLLGIARPWDFAHWQLAAQDGFSAALAGAGKRAPVQVTSKAAQGVVTIEPEGGWKLWLRLRDVEIKSAGRVGISSADSWIIIPSRPPRGPTDPALGLAVDARQVELPVAIGPLGDTIDELDLGITLRGAIPGGRLAEAAAAWRDAGGTIELDNLRLVWGGLGATATGTLALDRELQPIGGFSGAIRGYDRILTALVESGQMRATDAGLARIALTMLARPGPDGKPELKTGFRIQDGQMSLGPARLGKAPHITWE